MITAWIIQIMNIHVASSREGERMKLIIDIPEETYEYWKVSISDSVLANAIRNGTPLDEYEAIFTEGLLDGLKVSVKAKIQQKLHEPQYQHDGEDWKSWIDNGRGYYRRIYGKE